MPPSEIGFGMYGVRPSVPQMAEPPVFCSVASLLPFILYIPARGSLTYLHGNVANLTVDFIEYAAETCHDCVDKELLNPVDYAVKQPTHRLKFTKKA
jgi:hypothetical protein